MDRSNLWRRLVDGRTDLLFELIATGLPATAKDDNGVSLIEWCAYYGDVSGIRFLLAQGEKTDTLGTNLDLNGACFHGHWRLCQFLIEQGADVNHPLPDTGEVPLHAALCKTHRPAYDHVVRVLLAHGANPNQATIPGVETGSFMRDVRTRGETPLHRAAAFGTAAAIQMLLDAGAQVDARDVHGDSPLTWASWHNRSAAILQMLCFGSFRIHPAAVTRATSDGGYAWGEGMEVNLLGKPHVKPEKA